MSHLLYNDNLSESMSQMPPNIFQRKCLHFAFILHKARCWQWKMSELKCYFSASHLFSLLLEHQYFFVLLLNLIRCLHLCFIEQVNDCKTESSLCSATPSHAAPSYQGMAKVQDGHTNACDRYTVIHVFFFFVSALSWKKGLLAFFVRERSTAMLEEGQDGMDSGTLSPASARQVTIQRHPTQGFGFIAGSQRPVIVRSVSAGQYVRKREQERERASSLVSVCVFICMIWVYILQTAPRLASFSLETRSWPLTRRRWATRPERES